MNTPKEITQNYAALGVTKTQYPASKILVLGIFAGLALALSGVGSTIAMASVAGTTLAYAGKLLSALVFPAGLAIILIAGGELFTSNSLIIISVLDKQVKLPAMFKNWFFVYLGNFIGSMIVVLITVYGGTYSLFGNAAAVTAISTAVTKVSLPFLAILLRAIFCNFLVCVAVFMSFAAKDVVGKIAALFLPIMLFVLSGYEHSIANMYFIPTGLLAARSYDYYHAYGVAYNLPDLASLTWGSLFLKNLIPVTIGNIIGGAGFIGVISWFLYLREPGKKPVRKTSKKKR